MAQTAREASLARRKALSTSGKAAISGNADRNRTATATSAPASAVAPTVRATTATTQGGTAIWSATLA